jgi:transposase
MYYSIHSMANQGFSKRQVAERLGLDFRTVSKYLAMSSDEYNEKVLNRERRRDLDLYEGVVADWLKQHPDMTAAQVYDWLKEHYKVTAAERTARRFVGRLRAKYAIPKAKGATRQYEAMEDPPMGKQMQVDMGEAWVFDAYKRRSVKLYFVAAVLSHSRYKWAEWYTQPLNATRFTEALRDCFEYLGGMPKELVFDQDRVLAVEENYGDIIFTEEFERFRLDSGFEVYLCRASDPESKGRSEAVVKFIKNNFARNRQFVGIDIWNESFMDWLERTGNGKVHETTKKVPAEVFEQERLFLKPVPSTKKVYEAIVTRGVHKDNTIFYGGNRYSVPLGTYSPGRQVALDVEGGRLAIRDAFNGYVIAEHELSKGRGELVKNNSHRRDTSTKLDAVHGALLGRFGGSAEAGIFLAQIRKLKPRYARDQFSLIGRALDQHGAGTIGQALGYCLTNSLFSAVEFRDAAEYFGGKREAEMEAAAQNPKIVVLNASAAVSKKRDLSAYAEAAKGGGQG